MDALTKCIKKKLGGKQTRMLHAELIGWVLWHIKLCRLFHAKSIFMWIISSISNNSV